MDTYGRITFKNSDRSSQSLAGEIVHEIHHRVLDQLGEESSGREAERICIEEQNRFYARIGYPEIDIETVLQTEYWKIPYKDRNW